MVPLATNEPSTVPPTAVFFYEQTADALIDAVQRFDAAKFKTDDLIKHASHWGVPAFKKNIRSVVDSMIASGSEQDDQRLG